MELCKLVFTLNNNKIMEKKIMGKKFVTYEIAEILNKLGYNEPSFAVFDSTKQIVMAYQSGEEYDITFTEGDDSSIVAPLWQDVMEWLRVKHNIEITTGSHEKTINGDRPTSSCVTLYDGEAFKYTIYTYGNNNIYGSDFKRISYEESRELAILRSLRMIQYEKEK